MTALSVIGVLAALFEAEINVHYVYSFIKRPEGRSALAINADQISQTQIQTDFQRCQKAAASITLPARRKGTIPIDDRWLGR